MGGQLIVGNHQRNKVLFVLSNDLKKLGTTLCSGSNT